MIVALGPRIARILVVRALGQSPSQIDSMVPLLVGRLLLPRITWLGDRWFGRG
jgi:hypothetical protein